MENENNEVWKKIPIENFEKYHISNLGKCKNSTTNRLLTPALVSKYYMYGLSYKGKCTRIMIHRLVALAFIPKLDIKYDVVNHLDGNKFNNIVSNLEWTNLSGNTNHAVKTLNRGKSNKKVIRIDSENNETVYESITIAGQQNNTSRENIKAVLRGRSSKAVGYKWKYFDPSHNINIVDITNYKKIEGYENYYISKEGNVYSKTQRQFLTYNYVDGYPKVMLYKNAKPKCEYVHRLVALYFVPNPKNREFVNHINSDVKYPHFYNLEWVNKKENMLHSFYTKTKSIVLNELLKSFHGSGENSEVELQSIDISQLTLQDNPQQSSCSSL